MYTVTDIDRLLGRRKCTRTRWPVVVIIVLVCLGGATAIVAESTGKRDMISLPTYFLAHGIVIWMLALACLLTVLLGLFNATYWVLGILAIFLAVYFLVKGEYTDPVAWLEGSAFLLIGAVFIWRGMIWGKRNDGQQTPAADAKERR